MIFKLFGESWSQLYNCSMMIFILLVCLGEQGYGGLSLSTYKSFCLEVPKKSNMENILHDERWCKVGVL